MSTFHKCMLCGKEFDNIIDAEKHPCFKFDGGIREIIRRNELLIQTAEYYNKDTTPLQNIYAINGQLKELLK